jgi:predicted SprT family Zn-dependent metalloprotease
MRDQVLAWHDEYCQKLEEFCLCVMPGAVFVRPKVEFHVEGKNRAGGYSRGSHTCHYYLPYVAMGGYEETVAHEVCHAYQKQVLPESRWHGDFWKFLLRVVCGFENAERCHRLPVEKARKIGKLLRLSQILRTTGDSDGV